jgi:oligoribonuclease NrnB/cAMP/cGMP phosphodiesterase (DHH superfamily)
MLESTSVDTVIYHADCTDGFGAAYAAWKCLGNRADYYACKHGTEPPDIKGKRVVVLDFSFDNATTKKMIEESDAFLIIDHHKSAMVELHDISNTHFDMTKSGAMLAWEFFHPGKEPPKFIKYIQDRDLWIWELEYSKEFSAAFDMVPFEFEEFEKFEDDSVFDDAVKRGSFILAYSKTVVKKVCEKASSRKYKGLDVLVVNSSHWMSEIGARLSPDCDFSLIWYYDHQDRIIKVSLRSFHDKIDVSEIAKEFGGGGHKKASGFQLSGELCVDDIFDIDEEEEEIEDEESIDNEEKIQEESKNTKQENNLKELKENLKVLVKKVEEVELSASQEIITGSI